MPVVYIFPQLFSHYRSRRGKGSLQSWTHLPSLPKNSLTLCPKYQETILHHQKLQLPLLCSTDHGGSNEYRDKRKKGHCQSPLKESLPSFDFTAGKGFRESLQEPGWPSLKLSLDMLTGRKSLYNCMDPFPTLLTQKGKLCKLLEKVSDQWAPQPLWHVGEKKSNYTQNSRNNRRNHGVKQKMTTTKSMKPIVKSVKGPIELTILS